MSLDLNLLWQAPLDALQDPGQRFYWHYIVSSYLIGILWVWMVQREGLHLSACLIKVFPARAWRNHAVLDDLFLTWLTWIVQAILLGGIGLTVASAAQQETTTLLHHLKIPGELLHLSPGAVTIFGTILATLTLDIGLFVAHFLLHRIPWLWPFHAVHHSATMLTPLTGYRQHPIDSLINTLVVSLISGFFLGLASHWLGTSITMIEASGVALPVLLFYLFGYHLRHTDVWLDYGQRIDRVLISPAMHQIHHSVEKHHHDRNFGYIFSFWDRIAGTLYVPNKREELTFGLGNAKPVSGTFSLLLLPFKDAMLSLNSASLAGLALILGAILITRPISQESILHPPSERLWIENLTSQEIARQIKKGSQIAIIPTGGTEQNGPHLVTGKHNLIIRNNAEALAKSLGNTLIAPVIPYVPEGRIDPAEGHMRFAGTLSVREEIFEGLLEDTAKSLKAHGFQVIFFLGDSGGNQEGQRKIAEKLSVAWREDHVQVVALHDYYLNNGQLDYLRSMGIGDKDIGRHAGVRETAELEWISPTALRPENIKNHGTSDLEGSDGNPTLATPQLGESLTALKINAARRQAQAVISTRPALEQPSSHFLLGKP